MRLNKDLTKKFNKISRIISLDKFLHNDEYFFDDGQVEKIIDIVKENIKYSVIKLNTVIGENDYLVFTIIHTNDKSTTHQLMRSFNNKTKTNQYFKTLCAYISEASNEDIINKCYEELSSFPRKNIMTRIYGF